MEIKALVADSSTETRMNITRKLKAIGVRNVVLATDSDEAMKLFQTGTFDLVFAEWNTEIGAGEELAKSIRSIDAHVPIIVTAPRSKRMPELEKNCPSASTYLMLPFTAEQLRKTVGEYVPTIAG